jgi:hypothetical protein
MDAVAERKIPSPCRESNLNHTARSLVAISTELSKLTYTQVNSVRISKTSIAKNFRDLRPKKTILYSATNRHYILLVTKQHTVER